ncbi:MAG: hypothetical protein IID37_13490, partial [Planctomycetes bacterium]|nr:hypothetical protein [Planctomycetota bacterium]
MIEFKAECGHTVRAKDDDGGKVVRCSYCGRDARVPEQQDEVDGDLDFLFRDVEQSAESEAQSPGRRRSRRRSRSRAPFSAYSADRFNPLAVALKMVYVAVILIVVIFVGKKFIYPL